MRKTYNVILRHDSPDVVQAEYEFIEAKIGKENICLVDTIDKKRIGSTTDFWVTIRCTDEEWEDLKFHLDLQMVWT